MRQRDTPINIRLPILPGNKNAITIYPFIFWSKKRCGWLKKNLLAHELYHWNDQRRWKQTKIFGLLRWFMQYVYQWLWINRICGAPIQEHPMEKPACNAEKHS